MNKLIRLLFFFIFFFTLYLPVYAVEGEIPSGIRSSDISLSGEAQFYDSNHNSLTTTFYNTPGYMPYYAVNSTSNGFLSFQLNSALVTDVLYQLVVYFGYSSRIEGSMNPVAVGTWLTGANVNNQNGSNRADIWNYTNTYNIQTPMDVTLDSSLSPRVSNLAMAFYTFSVHNDGMNYINIPFSFQYSGQQVFYGYSLTVIKGINGLKSSDVQSIINNSGLATANSVSDVQRSIQDIQQDITTSSNNIIDNQNQTSGSIITNQNENTQQTINSQKVCKYIDKSNIKDNNKYLNSTGVVNSSNGVGITDYINILSSDITIVSAVTGSANTCFYNSNKELISCSNLNGLSGTLTVPSNSQYMRSTISVSQNKPTFNICTNGNQALYDSFNDSDSSGASSEASQFFNSFTTDTFGLTSIVTAPLNLIQSLTSSTCTNLRIPLPFVSNKYLELPCMTPIYQSYFGSLFTLYQSITFGIIAYWVCVRIFNQVKDFKNPEHDEIEVLDL